jgi:hypothetical protein
MYVGPASISLCLFNFKKYDNYLGRQCLLRKVFASYDLINVAGSDKHSKASNYRDIWLFNKRLNKKSLICN